MKCEDVRLQLDLLARGELEPELAAAVKLHLGSCVSCAREYSELKDKAALLSKAKAQAKAPDYLEDRIHRRFKQRYRRRAYIPKTAVAALLVLAVLSTVYVQATTGFFTDLDLLNLFTHGDEGIEHALRQGAGQIIDKQQAMGDVSVNLHSLIADGNRTVALFSVQGPEEADFARIQSFLITDKGGRVLSQTGGYIYSGGLVTGNIEAVSADRLGKTINVEFRGILFGKDYSLKDLVIDPHGQYPQTITVDEGLGSLTIESVSINADKLTMEITTNFLDSNFQSPRIDLFQGGEILRNDQSLLSQNRIKSTWTMTDPDGELRMDLEYRKTLVSVEETFSFAVRVDKKKMQEHTLVRELNQVVDLEPGVSLNLRKLTATSSQTVIEFYVSGESAPRVIEPDGLNLSVLAEGKPVDFRLDYDGGTHRIELSPAIPLDKLSVVVLGYYLIREGAVQYDLTPASVGSTLDFHGIPLIVEDIDTGCIDLIRFRLKTVNKRMHISSAALVVNGQGINPIVVSSEGSGDETDYSFDIVFPATGTEEWTLELGPVWHEYRNSDLTIQIP